VGDVTAPLALAVLLTVAEASMGASSDAVVLSQVLADIEGQSPAVLAAAERALAAERRADAAGAWSDPFVAIGPDEYALGAEPPMLRYQISQAIPLPGKIAPRVDAARAQTRMAEANVALARRQLRVLAIQLFVRALYVDEALAANAALRGTLDEIVTSAEARYATGAAAAHHEVLLAVAERATLERDALALARERAVLLGQIDELRARAPGDPRRRLVDDSGELTVPASFEDAVAAQPELAAAALGVEVAEGRRRTAAVAALPDLIVQGMAMQSFMPEVEPSTIGAMIGISVPIQFPWKQGALADAAARERSAWEVELRQLELRLRAEWQEAETRLKAAEDTLRLYDEKIAPATAAAVDSSLAAYAAQGAPLFEVLNVVRAGTTVELERAAAALDVRLAQVRLANLLSMPTALLLAPSSPTLFGGTGGGRGMGGMAGSMGSMGGPAARGMGDGRRPIRMGSGMTPGGLEMSGGEGDAGGMGGM
jgi:outer membrane protein, heavy metal efflux system